MPLIFSYDSDQLNQFLEYAFTFGIFLVLSRMPGICMTVGKEITSFEYAS